MKQENCKQRVKKAFKSRMEDIRRLVNYPDDEKVKEELGSIDDYGLSIDYVEAGTFKDQKEGYKRYQISWGGPSEEFRIYHTGSIEFWFLDWYDGASIPVTGEDAKIILNLTDWVPFE